MPFSPGLDRSAALSWCHVVIAGDKLHFQCGRGFLLLIVIYAFGIFCRNVLGNLSNSHYEGEPLCTDTVHHFGHSKTVLGLHELCVAH